MLKLSHFLIPMVVSLAGVCYAQDLGSEPVTATPASSAQEPASVSYQDLQTQETEESITQNETSEAAANSVPLQKKKKKSTRVKKQMELVPMSQTIQDFAKLRAEGERQHSKGVTTQLVGGIMAPVGIALMVLNLEGYADYVEGDKNGNGGAYALTWLGELLTTAAVATIITGGVMRKRGTQKIRQAEEAEILSFRERHNIMVIPVASFEDRGGGVVVAANF